MKDALVTEKVATLKCSASSGENNWIFDKRAIAPLQAIPLEYA